MWFREVSSDGSSSDDNTLTERLRNTQQSENIDWWKMTMDVNRMHESSTDAGGCGSSNLVACGKQTVLIIKIV
jgi:hypothetical protein